LCLRFAHGTEEALCAVAVDPWRDCYPVNSFVSRQIGRVGRIDGYNIGGFWTGARREGRREEKAIDVTPGGSAVAGQCSDVIAICEGV
jgi:hypothetical protein